jgi:hypothetical protein
MSTDKITHLPDSKHRQWRDLEPEYYAGLLATGYTEAETAACVARLKEVFLKYDMAKRVTLNPDDIAGSEAEIEGWLKPLVTGLMYEILMREIELYRLRGEVRR